MREVSELTVALGRRSYTICIGPGLLDEAGARIAPLLAHRRLFVVTDENVAAAGHLARLERALAARGLAAEVLVLPPGEHTKSFAHLERLIDDLLARGIERASTILALGGGVVGDLAGFAAAIVLRGVDYIQLPTTLLAQVDSAVGGKTGIDTRRGKNLVGAFKQPRLVLADTTTLDTLPPRELRAGFAEVVKYGCIRDPQFFAWLERAGARLLAGEEGARQRAIRRALEIKAEIVAADETEQSGIRALLNFGHTFAHALEALAGYDGRLLHGEAVAVGMGMAAELSHRLGLAPARDGARLEAVLAAAELPTTPAAAGIAADPDRVLALMRRDKKVAGGELRFVLWRGIGRAELVGGVEEAVVRTVLEAFGGAA